MEQTHPPAGQALAKRLDGRWLACALLAVVIGGWALGLRPQGAFDDAYITYRYADNLRSGLGFVYNPGEWVLGTTTPLYTLLLATLGLLAADMEWLGHTVGILGWLVAACGATFLLWDEVRPQAGVLAGLLVALNPLLMVSVGMETPWVVALMLWSAWAWLGNRGWLAAFLLAALLLTRQDAALWSLFLGLERWRRDGRPPWRVSLATVALTLPWFVFAWWRFGALLPNSVTAKVGQTRLMPSGELSFFSNLVQRASEWPTPATGALVMLAVALGLGVILWRARSLWWLPGWLIAFTLIYQRLGVVSFPWYFAPPLVVLDLLAAVGTGTLLAALRPPWRGLRAVGSLGLLLGVVLLLLGRGQGMEAARLARSGYVAAYRDAGHWLAQHAPADATVAAIEIGVIGYLSERPVLDTMGLVSPEMTDHLFGWGETLLYATTSLKPDYIVALRDTAWDSLVPQWWFEQQYDAVAEWEPVTLYQRRPLSAVAPLAVDARFVGGVRLDALSFERTQLEAGESVDAYLHLTVEQAQSADYLLTAYLFDPQRYERVALVTAPPFDGAYPSHLWQAGDVLTIPVRLPLPPDLANGAYQFGFVLYDVAQQREVLLEQGDQAPALQVGWLRVGMPAARAVATDQKLLAMGVAWQDGIQLERALVPPQAPPPGSELPITLHWQPTAVPTRNLTVFLHLLDASGQIVAQSDQRPFGGRFPTPAWQAGESLWDTVGLPLPATLPAGRYALRLGLYDESGQLPLLDGTGDFWLLPDVLEIAPP